VRVAALCGESGPHLRGFLASMLSAEFYGHATGNLVLGVRQGSMHAYKLSIIGCSEQSVLPFIVAKLAYSWPKSVQTVVLQIKAPTHTCACDSPSLGPFLSGPLSCWTGRKGSVRPADKCHCRGSSNLLYHAFRACGYRCCVTCYTAHASHICHWR
jgi:hypothetical protein